MYISLSIVGKKNILWPHFAQTVVRVQGNYSSMFTATDDQIMQIPTYKKSGHRFQVPPLGLKKN